MDKQSYEPQIFRLSSTQNPPPGRKKGWWAVLAVLVLALGAAAAFLLLDGPGGITSAVQPGLFVAAANVSPSATTTVSPEPTHTLSVTDTRVSPSPAPTRAAYFGTVIFGDFVDGYSQLLAVSPGDSFPRRITAGAWNDREPAVSPDGSKIVFRSDRAGSEDLFWLDTQTYEVHQITSTSAFEGNPGWSPDGQWICYEAHDGNDFDIWIQAFDGSELYTLTDHDAVDIEPAWNPAGRQIAFISDRSGSKDIYFADLADPQNRFENLTMSMAREESSPAFSPDGNSLAYAALENGTSQIYVLSLSEENAYPVHVGQGASPAWSPDGRTIAAVLEMPNTEQLVTYAVDQEPVNPLGLPLLSSSGLTWTAGNLTDDLDYLPGHPALPDAGQAVPAADAYGRYTLEELPDVEAPSPRMSTLTTARFNMLRKHVFNAAGWDVMQSLDNAFVGVNDPLPPGYAFNDWLYTGRAFNLNSAILPSGWAEAVREDYGLETYWRLYVRVLPQDGSLGSPLNTNPWDFDSRYLADPQTYDMGGGVKETVPEGYYLDLTELARSYGFERQPALPNWRRFIAGARYAEFAAVDGLSWEQAMAQIYPPEAVVTPTPYQTPTQTPTRTPRPSATPWWSY